MTLVSEIAEYYQHHVEIGELEPEHVPGPKEIAAEWEVSDRTARRARTLLLRDGFAGSIATPSIRIGPISDMDMAFRFLPNVLPRDMNGCLLWDGDVNGSGYGRFKLKGRRLSAHRAAYEYRHGPIPRGLEIDHSFAKGCRSKLCVNHEHLEPVTKVENAQRRVAAARWMAGIWVRTELDTD